MQTKTTTRFLNMNLVYTKTTNTIELQTQKLAKKKEHYLQGFLQLDLIYMERGKTSCYLNLLRKSKSTMKVDPVFITLF